MAKIKEKNPIQAERLKLLIKEQGMNQENFADSFNIAYSTLSKYCNAKLVIPNDFTARIIKRYPQYRIEWLLGIDDFKTNDEKDLSEMLYVGTLEEAFQLLLSNIGYRVKYVPDENNELKLDIGGFYVVEDEENNKIYLDLEYMTQLYKSMLDLAESRLKLLFDLYGSDKGALIGIYHQNFK